MLSNLKYNPHILIIILCLSINYCVIHNPNSTAQMETGSGNPLSMEKQLDKLFDFCVTNSQFSASVLIAHHGDIIYKKSFGMANIKEGIPINPLTNFNVASTTKPFTALGIALLSKKGKLHFDETVTTYLPDFPYESVTIRHLLTHTSGIPDYSHKPPFVMYHSAVINTRTEDKIFTSLDVLEWLIDVDLKPVFEPGSKMNYCNTGYVILALTIEQVSGKSYTEFITENILEPSGMDSSQIYTQGFENNIPGRALGYQSSRDRQSLILNDMNCLDGIHGDGGLYTSVEDLFKFDQALYTQLFFNEDIRLQIFSPHVMNDGQQKGYGLGWIISGYDDDTPTIVKHGGKWRGFTTAFQRLVEDSSSVIILCNSGLSGPTIGGIRDAATDILLGKELRYPKFPISDKIASVLYSEGADSAVAVFSDLHKNATERYFFDEHQLNIIGYNLMYDQRSDDAIKLLKANATAYPESANVYDSLGDAYSSIGDSLKAEEQYRKALLIDPELKHTAKKLSKIISG